LNGQPTLPLDVAFTPDGDAFATSNRDGVVTLWHAETGQAIGPRFEHHDAAVWRLAFAPGSVVVTASEDGTASVLDVLSRDRACEIGGGALDRRARQRYLGDREPVGCRG
jgi:WD40 repeat protein